MKRIIQVDLPDIDDTPTCGKCGEDFEDQRFYDNEDFVYLCAKCAEAKETE